MRYSIRNFTPDDIPGITKVINAADAFYNTEQGVSEEELTHRFSRPGLNPEQNVFVAEADGVISGLAALHLFTGDTEDSFRCWFLAHPVSRGQGLEDALIDCLYRRAQDRLGECRASKVTFSTGVQSTETDRIEAVKRLGMVEVRRGWVMVCSALESIPAVKFPDGIITRSYRVGVDDVGVHQADTEIFRDHWGHVEEPLEDWQHLVARPSFKPDLSIVAEDESAGEIAGFCTIEINDEENARLGVRRGWIEILGVRRSYRRKGLGTALVLTGLRNLRDAHVDHVALGCDAENQTGATRIYKRVGFHVHREQIIFSKEIKRPEPVRY